LGGGGSTRLNYGDKLHATNPPQGGGPEPQNEERGKKKVPRLKEKFQDRHPGKRGGIRRTSSSPALLRGGTAYLKKSTDPDSSGKPDRAKPSEERASKKYCKRKRNQMDFRGHLEKYRFKPENSQVSRKKPEKGKSSRHPH